MQKTMDRSELNDLISVIIPVYNTEEYLYRCLDSVINNTYRNLQIICVNDGSTDQSGKILDTYAGKDHRFIVIHKMNGGVSSARNEGLRAATGDYVSFVDSDDWLHPQYFEILMYVMKAAKSDLAISGFFHTDEYLEAEAINVEQIKWQTFGVEEMLSKRVTKNYICGKLFRKEIVRDCFFDEKISYSEDTLFNANVAFRSPGITVAYTEQPIYYYYDRQGSLVHIGTVDDLMSVGERMLSFAHKANIPAVKAILLKEAVKRLLAARYGMSVTDAPKKSRKKTNSLLRTCNREAVSSKCLSLADLIKYLVLIKCPQLYRLWRLRNDPTLLDWERKLKGKNQSQSNN